MTRTRLSRLFSWKSLIGTFALCAGLLGLAEGAGAKEFWFEAQELGKGKGPFEMGETEIWLPTAVVIDQKEDLNEPLWFVVKNPTGVDHEFAVAGLFMLVSEEEEIPETKLDPGSGGLLPRSIPVPIHLKVKAGETKKIQVSPRGLVGEKTWGLVISSFVPSTRISESAGSFLWTRSLSDIDLSTAANDVPTSALFSAPKNPQRIPVDTPPVFRGLWPRICRCLLRLVTKAMSDRLLGLVGSHRVRHRNMASGHGVPLS